jgi:hypothetical protein
MSGASAAMMMAASSALYSVQAGASLSGTHIGAYSVGIQFTTGGDINKVDTVGTTDLDDWVSPKAFAPGAYTIRAHQVSGTAVSGSALDTDLASSSNREWDLLQVGAGTVSAVLTLTLKDGGGNTLKTGNVTLQATAT